ncbi:glycosyltransferase family protein [Algoriphagus kandeliae]|uniref:glycosyltransferase family 4 protein n=1 Tax=Algoriphagus kandeliae TaxID=2562278 RepID=UPI0013866EC6|nr:glycosyltransferase family 4 protein [Algoriphagus kandeliae]
MKILFICPAFPPQSDVGGIRVAYFAKYFSEFGWDVKVITRVYRNENDVIKSRFDFNLYPFMDNNVLRIFDSDKDNNDYLNKRNYSKLVRDFFNPEYSSPPGFLDKALIKAFNEYNKIKFDVVVASLPDNWCLTLGEKISKENDAIFITDFRDIYEQDSYDKSLRTRLQVFRFKIGRFYRTRNAKFFSTVSSYMYDILSSKLKKRGVIIFNGYDNDSFYPLELSNKGSHLPLIITYTGRLLNSWFRNPEILFKAISELNKEGLISKGDLQIKFFGSELNILEKYIDDLNKDFIIVNEIINASEINFIINSSDYTLIINNVGPKGVLTTKLFESLGIGKKVVVIPGDKHELDALVSNENYGYVLSKISEVKKFLLKNINDKKNGISIDNSIIPPIKFSRKYQAKLLSDFIINNYLENSIHN